MSDKANKPKRLTIGDLVAKANDWLTVRAAILAASFAGVANVVMAFLGYNAGVDAIIPFALPKGSTHLDAETIKHIVTVGAAVIGVLADRFPEHIATIKKIVGGLFGADVSGPSKIDEIHSGMNRMIVHFKVPELPAPAPVPQPQPQPVSPAAVKPVEPPK